MKISMKDEEGACIEVLLGEEDDVDDAFITIARSSDEEDDERIVQVTAGELRRFLVTVLAALPESDDNQSAAEWRRRAVR